MNVASGHDNHFRTFRDPAGRLFNLDDRMIRVVSRSGMNDLKAFLDSRASKTLVENGSLVRTDVLEAEETEALVRNIRALEIVGGGGSDEMMLVEHERVPFQSFPYEWPAELLHAAARLTLELAETLLDEGMGLKDATPYNILFRGPNPVFVDLLSFEQRDPADPIWLPEAQFVRAFLLPLLVNRYFDMPIVQLLSDRRDGLEPEEVYRMSGGVRRLLPPFLSLVSIPTWLAARHSDDDTTIYRPRKLDNTEKARFILRSLFRRLRRSLDNLEPKGRKTSAWSDYMTSNNNYSEDHFRAKQTFVAAALTELRPETVLAVGCNIGYFSEIAARSGARVVAIDSDAVVAGETWRRARAANLDILPLVLDLTRPTPATGWRNAECASFLDRARGAFDAIFMLAVIHHMLVTERIPVSEILELAAELTRDIVIVEFVGPEDTMFRRLVKGRDNLFAGLTVEVFEEACRQRFEVVRSQHLEGTSRWLFLLRKKRESTNG
jgi:2-polyprenyl-3-methyl-5-hydroxy-6-metoxy-1,4-benzoquinol methylase